MSPARVKGYLARRRARRQVRQVIAEAEEKLNARLNWNDDGPTVCAQQAWWGFEALRASAKWLDLRDHLPSFDDPPEGNFYKHPAWKDDSRRYRFSHIIDHSCHSGYFVPCRFDPVVLVEPYQVFGRFTFYHSFGSSHTLADQLDALEEHIPAENASDIAATARDLIRHGFATLKQFSQASITHALPIVFWG
jgi:hypothetical protein